MAIFEAPDQLYSYISELFEEIATLPEAQAALKSLNLRVQFNYTQPDCTLTLTAANGEWTIARGIGEDTDPDIELTMTGDVAYKFWTGKLNVMGALMTREIGVIGSLGKVMRLEPLIKTAVRYNRERETGYDS
ncbi:SCP2 sterol-binding domain-containing protein [Candidatus Poribacteria bacterium]|nr:SCP2 sterol-binding domain-containing protein [Candidatus Poribacteria bacterium]MXY27121.1 SCP2 sterol-binding domain-containing protein [Candidatus Poribacteria bacterium]MYK17946.1 SCP2 sterol-binding domain-containing protein [Candidatus Poribacteria bacterium]